MATAIDDPRLKIGANNPPPLDSHRLHIEELMAEAQGFLDGQPIANQAQADDVGKLLGMLREAYKGADTQRAVEKKPHDDASKAVQAAWMPLLTRVKQAEDVAKQALAPFLIAQDAEKRRIADEARAEADRKTTEAQAAIAAAQSMSLAAREQSEALIKEAAKAAKIANRAEKDKPLAAGMGRSVGLVSVWTATVDDYGKLLAHYKMAQPGRIKDWLDAEAQRDVAAGIRKLAGVTITESRVAR